MNTKLLAVVLLALSCKSFALQPIEEDYSLLGDNPPAPAHQQKMSAAEEKGLSSYIDNVEAGLKKALPYSTVTRMGNGLSINHEPIYFDQNSVKSAGIEFEKIEILAKVFIEFYKTKICLIGHLSSAETNKESINESRVNFITSQLVKRGIDASRITCGDHVYPTNFGQNRGRVDIMNF